MGYAGILEKEEDFTVLHHLKFNTGTLCDSFFRKFCFKEDTDYTLSFYAKGTQIATHFYTFSSPSGVYNSVPISKVYFCSGSDIHENNSNFIYNLSEDWSRCFVSFRIKSGEELEKYPDYKNGEICLDILFRNLTNHEFWLKKVKLEEGINLSPWCPSLSDCEVSWIKPNLLSYTSGEWSSWFYPENKYNWTVRVGSGLLGESSLGPKTCSIEIEVEDMEFSDEENSRSFIIQLIYKKDGPDTSLDRTSWYSFWEPYPVTMKFQNGIYTLRGYLNKTDFIYGSAISIQIRSDFWSSGRYRFRFPRVKDKYVRNPIWCKSEIDVSNPNQLNMIDPVFGIYNSSEDALGECIENDNPQIPEAPYISKSWSYRRTQGSGIPHIDWSYKRIPVKGETWTFSFYARTAFGKESGNCYLQLAGGGEYKDDYFYYISPGKEWKRYVYTLLVKENYIITMYGIYGGGGIEIAGVKAEISSFATAWVPI